MLFFHDGLNAFLSILFVLLTYIWVFCETYEALYDKLIFLLLIFTEFHRLGYAVVQFVGHEEKVDFVLYLSTWCRVEILQKLGWRPTSLELRMT